MTITLPYGLSEAVPENAKAAWGARFIVTQDGHVDLPPDRHGFAYDGADGTESSLLDAMQEAMPLGRLRTMISGMLTTGILNTRTEGRVLIFTDENITIVGDTKASAGYLYVAAFRTPDPDNEWRDFHVTMTLMVNIPISAHNAEFTTEDAKQHAIEAVMEAIEGYTAADAEVAEIMAVQE